MEAYAECQRDMEGQLGIVQVQNNKVATPRDTGLRSAHCLLGGKLCPRIKYIAITPRRLSTSQQVQVTRDRKDKSLRELARDYGVSHETVRRVLKTNEVAE